MIRITLGSESGGSLACRQERYAARRRLLVAEAELTDPALFSSSTTASSVSSQYTLVSTSHGQPEETAAAALSTWRGSDSAGQPSNSTSSSTPFSAHGTGGRPHGSVSSISVRASQIRSSEEQNSHERDSEPSSYVSTTSYSPLSSISANLSSRAATSDRDSDG